ncbi:MAG: hypothetical protein R3A80_01485 [Bdellovibrionota bacterium]
MNELSSEDLQTYRLAREWANKGELQASFIVIEALLKKQPTHFQLFLCFIELLEEISPIKAHSLYTGLTSGDDKWQEFYLSLSNVEKATLLEKSGILALRLKDESSALEQLKNAASLGRDSLQLWGTLSYLHALYKDSGLAVKALCRSLELYKEPSLFEENFFFLNKNRSQNNISEELFLNICLSLFPQLACKDALKLLSLVKSNFPDRTWCQELQDIVAQDKQNVPIGLSGEHYVSSDKKNW